MNGKLHLTLGTAVGVTGGVCLISNPMIATGYISSSMIGSLFPDIDLPNSKLGKYTFGLSIVFNKLFGHRGLFYTPCFTLLTLVLYKQINNNSELLFWIFIGFLTGFTCHLIQDSLTKGGIKLLYPFSRRTFSITDFESDHVIHNYFTLVLVLLNFAIIPRIVEFLIIHTTTIQSYIFLK